MSTIERFDVHQFGHSVKMVMASAFDEQAEEVKRLKMQVLELQLKVSDQYLESCADTVLIQRVIAENSALRSDVDVLGNVLDSSINHAARYLDAHKAFRAHVKRIAEDANLDLGSLRDALSAVK